MDVDEFLDRELAGLDLPIPQDEKPTLSANADVAHAGNDTSQLSDNIKASLSSGNLEQAEQLYLQLWNVFKDQKLKWNKDLYDQLLSLANQFSKVLNYTYAEVKKKVYGIYTLINQARDAMTLGKSDIAFKLYSQMQEINNSIPSIFFEEKKIVQEQVLEFYKDLKNMTDGQLVKRIAELVQETNQLISDIYASMSSNDIQKSALNYNKCLELYDQIPEGFIRYKNSIGIRILEIYKSISINTEISSLQGHLRQSPRQKPLQKDGAIFHEEVAPQQNPKNGRVLDERKIRAKKNIENGLYDEAQKEIDEALRIEPNDAELKALNAKVKTLQ